MKRIEAVIRPERLSSVLSALTDIGHGSVMVSEVRSHGDELGFTRQWRRMAYVVDVQAKSRIELLVQDQLSERVVSVIRENACTGGAGDGAITIFAVEDAIEVSTGDHLEGRVRTGC